MSPSSTDSRAGTEAPNFACQSAARQTGSAYSSAATPVGESVADQRRVVDVDAKWRREGSGGMMGGRDVVWLRVSGQLCDSGVWRLRFAVCSTGTSLSIYPVCGLREEGVESLLDMRPDWSAASHERGTTPKHQQEPFPKPPGL
jgi:hypothetical protein